MSKFRFTRLLKAENIALNEKKLVKKYWFQTNVNNINTKKVFIE